MLKQKTITVESVDYLLTTIPAIKALQLQPKVMKLLGRSIATFLETASSVQEGSTEMEAQVLQRIAEVFLEDLDKIDIAALAQELIACGLTCQNMAIDTPQKFNNHFSGELVSLYKVLFEVIHFNFLEQLLKLVSNGNVQPKTEI